jgi:phosphocarrier protein
MVSQAVQILNQHGLHTRPATVMVSEASRYEADIFVVYNGVRVNAKSILGLLVLAVEPKSFITIEADGKDEQKALEALVELTMHKFNME